MDNQDNQKQSAWQQLKPQIKSAFTEFPWCIPTYLAIAIAVGLVVCNWSDIVAKFK